MESKKHPKANLENKRGLFFQIGLVLAIGITLLAFEWKTYETHVSVISCEFADQTVEELVPITFQQPAPQPPPPPTRTNPDILALVDNTTKPTEEVNEPIPAPVPFIEIPYIPEKPIVEEVVYGSAQRMPTFPGCETESSEMARQNCSSLKLMRFLSEHIKYPAMAKDAGIEGKVFINFVIDSKGEVKNVELLRGIPNGALLDKEAMRVVGNLPNFNPGKQQGKAVSVRYTLPVIFALRRQ